MNFRRARVQSVPFLLTAGLLALILPLVGSCGSDDDETTNNGGPGVTLCADGEHRYYCVTITITDGEKSSVVTEVIDICDDSDGIAGAFCDLEIDGSNVSTHCELVDEDDGCIFNVTIDLSGTLTDQMINVSGTVTTTTDDAECEDEELGTLNYVVVGERVDGPNAECGEGGGNPGDPGTFAATVTTPSGDVELDGIMVGTALPVGHQISGTASVNGTMYSLSVWVPEITGDLPQSFPVNVGDKDDAASLDYIEFSIEPPVNWYLSAVSAGSLTVSSVSETALAGSFDITGTVSTEGDDDESRVLAGQFNAALSEGVKAASAASLRGEAYRQAVVQRLVRNIFAEAWDLESSLVGP